MPISFKLSRFINTNHKNDLISIYILGSWLWPASPRIGTQAIASSVNSHMSRLISSLHDNIMRDVKIKMKREMRIPVWMKVQCREDFRRQWYRDQEGQLVHQTN